LAAKLLENIEKFPILGCWNKEAHVKARVIRMMTGFLMAWLLAACSVHDIPDGVSFDAGQRWALLPILNYSEEPLAGERAEAMLDTLLRMRGVDKLTHYPTLDNGDFMPELNERKRLEQSLAWARSQGFRYGLTGIISEWRYKSGLDAEPAVGITLQIVDIVTGQVVWSTSGARSGWGRESLSGNAQKVMRSLVESIHLLPKG